MFNSLLPSDIPDAGARYDLRVIKTGFDEDERLVVQFAVDTGEHKGKTVSGVLTDELYADFPAGQLEPGGRVSGRLKVKARGKFYDTRTNTFNWRPVPPKDHPADCYEVRITYDVDAYGPAENESDFEMPDVKDRSRFVRA